MRVPKLRATFVQEGSVGVLVVSGKWSLPRWSSPVTVRLPGRFVGLSYLLLGALCGALRCDSLRCSSLRCSSSEMSHVIPSRVFQTLKSHRWNSAVFSIPMKSRVPKLRATFDSSGTWVEFLCAIIGTRRCAPPPSYPTAPPLSH